MSEIDGYKHTCPGVVHCPSPHPIAFGSDTRDVFVYRLDEDALDSPEWQAKSGDIVLGGGSGEAAILRVAMPEAILFFTHDDWDGFDVVADVYRACWSMTEAYIFGAGYVKMGWDPSSPIETWLAEHITAFVLREYPECYEGHLGPQALAQVQQNVRGATLCMKKPPDLDESGGFYIPSIIC